MRKVLAFAALAVAAVGLTAETCQAQYRVGHGGWGIGSPYFSVGVGRGYYGRWNYGPSYYGSSYYNPGYYGSSYYNPGYYGRSYYGNYGYWGPGYTYGGAYLPSYYGIQYSTPMYSSYSTYAPAYYGLPAYSSGVQVSSANLGQSRSYQSYYPSTPSNNQAMVRVSVPQANARVWIDDQQTQQTGSDRLFVTPALEQGKKYSYTVRATWMDNGHEVTREKKVPIEPGQTATVQFTNTEEKPTDAPPKPQEPVQPKPPQ